MLLRQHGGFGKTRNVGNGLGAASLTHCAAPADEAGDGEVRMGESGLMSAHDACFLNVGKLLREIMRVVHGSAYHEPLPVP